MVINPTVFHNQIEVRGWASVLQRNKQLMYTLECWKLENIILQTRLKLLFFLLKENQRPPKFHSSILGRRKKKVNHLSEDLMERMIMFIAFFFFCCFCRRMGPSCFLFHCYCWYYPAQNSKISLSDSLFSSCYSLFHNCTTLFLVKWS